MLKKLDYGWHLVQHQTREMLWRRYFHYIRYSVIPKLLQNEKTRQTILTGWTHRDSKYICYYVSCSVSGPVSCLKICDTWTTGKIQATLHNNSCHNTSSATCIIDWASARGSSLKYSPSITLSAGVLCLIYIILISLQEHSSIRLHEGYFVVWFALVLKE